MHSGRNRQIEVSRPFTIWASWSFARKLLVLLAVPLVVQLALFVALCVALTHAQSLSTRFYQQQKLIEALDRVLLDKGIISAGLFQRSIIGAPISARKQNEVLSRVSVDIDKVRENPTVDSEILSTVDNIEASYQSIEREQTALKGLSLLSKVSRFYELTNELQTFHDQILRKVERNQDEYMAARQKITAFAGALFGGVLLDICVAFASLNLFNRGLNKSLRALTENSEKVAAEEDLPHRLEGSDELGTINDALHQSHNQLLEVKLQRQALNDMIANDVRKPLISIGTLIGKLSQELVKTSSPLVDEVKRLEKNVQTVHKHVDDLLAVEKRDDGKIELETGTVNLKMVLDDVCYACSEMASQKGVRINLQAGECSVPGDAARLAQVIQNYLSNAIKFSPSGAEVLVQLVATAEFVSVRVKDSGPGIKLSEQAQLFSKFYQAGSDQKEKGFGLGLSICKELIELHGGEVGVTSRPGAGATFWFTLPAYAAI